jgi:hypothetical protein
VDIFTGVLSFGNPSAQLIQVTGSSDGIGVQPNTLYFRSDGNFDWYAGGTHNNSPDNPGGGVFCMKLDGGGNLSLPSGNLSFGAQTQQMINLGSAKYGIGAQPNTHYFRTDSDFCWYKGGTFSNVQDDPGGGIRSMKLDANSNLTISGNLQVNAARTYLLGLDGANNHWIMGGGTVEPTYNAIGLDGIRQQVKIGSAWTLNVQGPQNIFMARQFTRVVKNAGQDTPGSWTIPYGGLFSSVYAVFAVLQGFSIFDNTGTGNKFTNGGHVAGVGNIPQHAYVRVDLADQNSAHGVAYCSESDVTAETDNCILFTLVVLGCPIV